MVCEFELLHLLVGIAEQLLPNRNLEQKLRVVTCSTHPLLVLACLRLGFGCRHCHLGELRELRRSEAIELHEILHGFLAPLLKQIDLPTYQVSVPELRELIDALSGRHEALVMLTNLPLDYRFQ